MDYVLWFSNDTEDISNMIAIYKWNYIDIWECLLLKELSHMTMEGEKIIQYGFSKLGSQDNE